MDCPRHKNAVAPKLGKASTWPWALFLALTVLFFDTRDAWAIQTHSGGEGMIVHQFAHLHYILALCILLWDLYRPNFMARSWPLLRYFCLLMILWNCLAITGHFAQDALPDGDIATEDGYLSAFLLLPLSFNRWIYYVAALDHLLCVPALFCLFLAMRRFYRDSLNSQPANTQQGNTPGVSAQREGRP